MKPSAICFEDLLKKLERYSVEDEFIDDIPVEGLNYVIGADNYLILKDVVVCIVIEGVVVLPYYMNSDMEYYAYRLIRTSEAFIAEGERLEEVKKTINNYEENLRLIQQYLQ